MKQAKTRFQSQLDTRSFTLKQAAARYRERRGRHPPPGFDKWFEQAKKDDAVIVEQFFDRIYHDITPFWALKPADLRKQASHQPQLIRIRNGKAWFVTDDPSRQPWIQLWTALVKEMMPHLPDLDMVINFMDESRVLVPWEKMSKYVKTEQSQRKLISPEKAISTYSGLKDGGSEQEKPYDPGWITKDSPKYWDYFRRSCPPRSPGRKLPALKSFNVTIEYPRKPLPYTMEGFVENFTQAQDPCLQPHLRGMHGTFIESVSISTTDELFPIFGGSKLPQNNELLIPGAMYLTDRDFYSGGTSHGPPWRDKRAEMVWRGTASGGRNKKDNWWHFHRHRWVQMLNGTTLAAVGRGDSARGPTFKLPGQSQLPGSLRDSERLSRWVSSVADVAFVDLECFPSVQEETGIWQLKLRERSKTCPYTSPFFSLQHHLPMKKQYDYKLLPDVDGNSFSGRWRAFLQSTSLPLKSTIYTEWHDDRIVPWLHFVPFDNSYMDIYAIVHFFLEEDDEAAEEIAEEGARWSQLVYRRPDMKLYVWRLLLEYARVVDDERDYLGFVEDLL
ncbi:Lipopolysaccharide-modifying protein [Ophiocordyceps camponoti-floridani]|uniref:Lipopolysaccharide-modifying protein n=1 Tax=Ophiocordyceps camponoti-floridani TaxID=2030778 RepID=A0A8H4VFP5_9HYPO|nr:Lipopolysaccharide-modifying protein [Ophiocordyceps camponoti-floridani]